MERELTLEGLDKILLNRSRSTKTYLKCMKGISSFLNNIEPKKDFKNWRIGITNNVKRRGKEHKRKYNILNDELFYMYGGSKYISRVIEADIQAKFGLKQSNEGNPTDSTKYVYLFKICSVK